MKRRPVFSTRIKSVGYDPDSQVLEIEFTDNSVYEYDGVPKSKFDGLVGSYSIGKYFEENIKNSYAGNRL